PADPAALPTAPPPAAGPPAATHILHSKPGQGQRPAPQPLPTPIACKVRLTAPPRALPPHAKHSHPPPRPHPPPPTGGRAGGASGRSLRRCATNSAHWAAPG